MSNLINETTEMWREYKEAGQKKRLDNKQHATERLTKLGIDFESKNCGVHVIDGSYFSVQRERDTDGECSISIDFTCDNIVQSIFFNTRIHGNNYEVLALEFAKALEEIAYNRCEV